MAIPDNLTKAYLKIEGGEQIDCWFNPAEYTITKIEQVEGRAGRRRRPARPPSSAAATPQKLTLDLLFDAADHESGDVRGITNALFAAMAVDKELASGKNSGRPPTIEFGWGSTTTFDAVCDSLSRAVHAVPAQRHAGAGEGEDLAAPGRADGRQGRRRTRPPGGTGRPAARTSSATATASSAIAHQAYGDPTLWRRDRRGERHRRPAPPAARHRPVHPDLLG